MIFTDRTIIVQKGTSSINDTIILYRGDKGVEIRFTLNEGSPFRFGSGASPNIIEKTEAAYGQLIIKRPNDLPAVFSEIAPTNEGKIVFKITGEMIDEITEVGYYTFQIRLFDENQESRATIPEVIDGIEIREPIASEDGANEVGVATVGYALTTAAANEDTFDAQGNYNKTTWATGDRITAAKLNKMETGIDEVNKKIASNASDISITDTGNYFTSTNVEGALEEAGSQIKEKADKTTTNNIQQQVNNLVLGAVGDGNNAEIIQSRGDFSVLNERLNAIVNEMTLIKPINLFDESKETNGYMNVAGGITPSSTTLYYSDYIKVNEGEHIVATYQEKNIRAFAQMRFVTAFDYNKNVLSELGGENLNEYLIPSGVSYIVVTYKKTIYPKFMIYETQNINSTIEYSSYFEPYYKLTKQSIDEYLKPIEESINTLSQNQSNFEESINTLSQNQSNYTLKELDNTTLYYIDDDEIIANITLNSKDSIFYIVRELSVGNGTRVCYVDFSSNEIGIFRTTDTSNMDRTNGEKQTLSFTPKVGRTYIITSSKKNGTDFDITITDSISFESHTFTMIEKDYGSGQGIRKYKVYGNITVNKFKAYSTQPYKCKLAIIGDSFVEGNQLGYENKKYRYCKLIKDDLGGDCFISGHAGKNATWILDKYKSYINDLVYPKYCLLAFGTNDTDFNQYKTAMEEFISILQSKNIIPILVTVTLRSDNTTYNTTIQPAINDWVKNSGLKYVDFATLLTTNYDGVTQNTNMYLNENNQFIHPNVEANKLMHKKFKVDMPEIFI